MSMIKRSSTDWRPGTGFENHSKMSHRFLCRFWRENLNILGKQMLPWIAMSLNDTFLWGFSNTVPGGFFVK